MQEIEGLEETMLGGGSESERLAVGTGAITYFWHKRRSPLNKAAHCQLFGAWSPWDGG